MQHHVVQHDLVQHHLVQHHLLDDELLQLLQRVRLQQHELLAVFDVRHPLRRELLDELGGRSGPLDGDGLTAFA